MAITGKKPSEWSAATINAIKTALPILINEQTGTTYTIQITDNWKTVECTNVAAITVTFPKDTLSVGMSGVIEQTGAGQVTVVGAADVVVNGYDGLKTAGQYAALSWIVRASNVIRIYGGVA